MKELAIRLEKGTDLKKYLTSLKIDCGVILSGVGCLSHLKIRLAGAKDFLDVEDDFEIVSLNGTICKDGVHIHIACSDSSGKVFGGHLLDGSIINTTAELVIGILEEYDAKRVFDKNTGYNEIVFMRK